MRPNPCSVNFYLDKGAPGGDKEKRAMKPNLCSVRYSYSLQLPR